MAGDTKHGHQCHRKRLIYMKLYPAVVLAFAPTLIGSVPVDNPMQNSDYRNNVSDNEAVDIVVIGLSDKYKFNPKQIKAALKEFSINRERFAPRGKLYFQVWKNSSQDRSNLHIAIKSGAIITDLPIDGDQKFVIPDLPGDDWSLVANKRQEQIVIIPVVMSPETTDDNRLLGDLRLQCRVNWAISSTEVSVFVKGMFSASGGCSGRKFAYYATSNRPISSAVASNDRISKPLQIWRSNKYRVPVGDRELGNETRVRITPIRP